MTDKPITDDILRKACGAFAFCGDVRGIKPCGNGHINHTFIVTTEDSGTRHRYILQVLNTDIFRDPDGVMENIVRVTEHIRAGLIAGGGDAERGCLHVIPSSDNAAAGAAAYRYVDGDGRFWRAYDFVEHTVCRLTMDNPDTFRKVGWAFGNFQHQLSDFDASALHESIPNFHNTKQRYADFLSTLSRNPAGRAAQAEKEIAFLTARGDRCSLIVDALGDGRLPLRVTHNDTKLSNILLDESTEECVCVIDLDTVMPGSALYDFGDSIRTGACTAAEDEPDAERVDFRADMFRAYAEGFVSGTDGALTTREIEMLPDGAYIITLEQAIRFLTDYLDGDAYYHTDYADHNLVRTRTQIRMLMGMERDETLLRQIVAGLGKV
jgi:Ser/Thr protein kinase RdoA (MazF antagonist)